MQNALLILGNVAAKMSATFPLAGVGHSNRRQLEREIDVLVLANAILMLTRLRPAQFDSILHFCNFSERDGQILHYRHIFALLAGLTVYLEIGEQTGSLKEIFKLFLRMVPLYPRFFSYK